MKHADPQFPFSYTFSMFFSHYLHSVADWTGMVVMVHTVSLVTDISLKESRNLNRMVERERKIVREVLSG